MSANVSNISTVASTWHRLEEDAGNVLDASIRTPRQMFEEANALFEIEKRPMYSLDLDGKLSAPHKWMQIYRKDTGAQIPMLRPVGSDWKEIQNEKLLEMAERLGDHITMDTVVVMNGGAKIAFTGKIVGTETSILPEDEVCRYFCGYLGHDGASAFGGMFINHRVVCENTMGYAHQVADSREAQGILGKQMKIHHSAAGIAVMDELMQNIDMARQMFPSVAEAYRRMNEVDMSFGQYVDWLNSIYKMPPIKTDEGLLRPGVVQDYKSKYAQLESAWTRGIGLDDCGFNLYRGLNAVTQVESSPKTASSSEHAANKIRRAFFGTGSNSGRKLIERAEQSALALVTAG